MSEEYRAYLASVEDMTKMRLNLYGLSFTDKTYKTEDNGYNI